MSTEEIHELERKYKIKRQTNLYGATLQEAEEAHGKNIKVYIHRLCLILREEEYPEVDLFSQESLAEANQMRREIKERIKRDVYWWKSEYIMRSWPDWMKPPLETIHVKSLKYAHKIKAEIADDLEEFNLVSGTWRNVKPQIGQSAIVEREPTERMQIEVFAEFMRASSKLWWILTGNNNQPSPMSDVYIDLIKPTRGYWNVALRKMEGKERTMVYNNLVWQQMLIKDRLELTESVDKSKTTEEIGQ